jgi:hypothetical protein
MCEVGHIFQHVLYNQISFGRWLKGFPLKFSTKFSMDSLSQRNVKLANLSNNTCVSNSKLGTNVASKIPTNWNE